jgi:glycerol-1-phosphate dehydrogenase [NAD(P)+]
MSGLAMQAGGSSRPASGAEHQFSHLWEMEGLGYDDDPPLSHGFKVGLGTIAIAGLYERLLERDLTHVEPDPAWPTAEELEARVRSVHPRPALADAAVKESLAKHPEPEALAARLAVLRERWPDLRERLREQLLPADTLREMLGAAGCPTTPEAVGLSREDFRATFVRARTIRRRYTALDLAAEAGVLDACVAELFPR